MTRRTPALLAIAFITAGALVACNNESAPEEPTAGGTPASSTASTSGAATSGGSPAPTEAATQETSDGAVALFVDSMQAADLQGAADVTDESSLGYSQITEMVEALARLDSEAQKAVDAGGSATQFSAIKDMLIAKITSPWADVKTNAISERKDKARFTFDFGERELPNGEVEPNTMEFDVVKKDGLWYVFAPEGILDAGITRTAVPSGQANTPG